MNAAFAMAILDLISRVHLPSFVNMLPKYLKRGHIHAQRMNYKPSLHFGKVA